MKESICASNFGSWIETYKTLPLIRVRSSWKTDQGFRRISRDIIRNQSVDSFFPVGYFIRFFTQTGI